MSTRVVIVWLIVAVTLGAAAIFLMQSRSSRSPAAGPVFAQGENILDFAPGDVERIEFHAPDRTRELIRREPALSSVTPWLMTIERVGVASDAGATAQAGPEWPVVESRVQAFVQKLLETRCVSAPDQSAKISSAPIVVKLLIKGNRTIRINVDQARLGGTGLVEIIDESTPAGAAQPKAAPRRLALIDDWLHQVVAAPGPRAWRDTTALMLSRTDVSRVALEAAAQPRIALGRVGGKWGMREPVTAPADPKAVQSLLVKLSKVEIRNFLDDGPGNADTKLDLPAAKAMLEYDKRTADADPKIETIKNSLTVGGTAAISSAGTPTGDRVYASIDNDRVVMVDARALAELSMHPGAYIWPHPSIASPADVGVILLEVRSPDGSAIDTPADPNSALRKDLDRWVGTNPDGSSAPMIESAQREVAVLLAFLTGTGTAAEQGAAAVDIKPPTRFTQFGRITLLSLGSSELEQIDIGEAGGGLVTFKTGPVYRTYPQDRLPALVAHLRARAKAAGVPIEGVDTPVFDPHQDTPMK